MYGKSKQSVGDEPKAEGSSRKYHEMLNGLRKKFCINDGNRHLRCACIQVKTHLIVSLKPNLFYSSLFILYHLTCLFAFFRSIFQPTLSLSLSLSVYHLFSTLSFFSNLSRQPIRYHLAFTFGTFISVLLRCHRLSLIITTVIVVVVVAGRLRSFASDNVILWHSLLPHYLAIK